MGLPFAFASHFAPQMLDEALHIYRSHFRPSAVLDTPHAIAAFNVIAAEIDAEAEYLASSLMQSFVALRTGNPRQLPPPIEGYVASLPPHFASALNDVLSASAIGAADTVKAAVQAFQAHTQADEIIVACSIFDHEKRKRSLEITASVFADINKRVVLA